MLKYPNSLASNNVFYQTLLGLLLVTGLIFLNACSQNTGEEASAMQEFEKFYQAFHQDEAFQFQHISFPLEGLPAHADAETIAANDFVWEAEDWVMQRPFDFSNGKFHRELVTFGDDLVVEKIVHQNSKFGTIRRFAKLGKEWYLIYYAGLNRIQSND